MDTKIFNTNINDFQSYSSKFDVSNPKLNSFVGLFGKTSGTLLSDKGSCKVCAINPENFKQIKNYEQLTKEAIVINVHAKGVEIITSSQNVEQIRKKLAENRTLTIMHPNGSEITHNVNDISVRAFTAEEFSYLEKALAQYFNNILADRKKAAEAKASGTKIETVRDYPEVPSTKIKDSKPVPAFRNTMDPEFPTKAVKAVLAELLSISSLRQQRREEETLKKEDKIKDQEQKRSEARQEIKNESIKKQNEVVEETGKRNKKRKKAENLNKVK